MSALCGGLLLQEEYVKKFNLLLPKLRRFAYGLSGSVMVAEDLVQEAFTRLLSADGGQERYAEQWLFRIVRNLYIDLIRKEDIRDRYHERAKEFSGGGNDGTTQIETLITLAHVRDLIKRLPDEQREVLLLVGGEGSSYREASEILELPIGTVTSRLARARNRLLSSYSECGSENEALADGGVK